MQDGWSLQGLWGIATHAPTQEVKSLTFRKRNSLRIYKNRIEVFENEYDIEVKFIFYLHTGTSISALRDGDGVYLLLARPHMHTMYMKLEGEKSMSSIWLAEIKQRIWRLNENFQGGTISKNADRSATTSFTKKRKMKYWGFTLKEERDNCEVPDVGIVKRHFLDFIHRYSYEFILQDSPHHLRAYLIALNSFLQAKMITNTYRARFRTIRNVIIGDDIIEELERENIIVDGDDEMGLSIGQFLLQTRLISRVEKAKEGRSKDKLQFKAKELYRFARTPPSFVIVKVVVKCGKNLVGMDLNGFSDPYAVITMGQQQFKTKTIKKSLNPLWSEEFYLVSHPQMDDQNVPLKVQIYDYDTFTVDNFIGQFVIPDPVNAASQQTAPKWYTLTLPAPSFLHDTAPSSSRKGTRGQVKLSLSLLEWRESSKVSRLR